MKLILLEDDPLILVCTQDALGEAGFEVFPAISGAEALELLSESLGCVAMMVDVHLADERSVLLQKPYTLERAVRHVAP